MWAWLYWSSGILLHGWLAGIPWLCLSFSLYLCLAFPPGFILPCYRPESFFINQWVQHIFTEYRRIILQQHSPALCLGNPWGRGLKSTSLYQRARLSNITMFTDSGLSWLASESLPLANVLNSQSLCQIYIWLPKILLWTLGLLAISPVYSINEFIQLSCGTFVLESWNSSNPKGWSPTEDQRWIFTAWPSVKFSI